MCNTIVGRHTKNRQSYAFGLIFQFGYNIFSSILRAIGDSAATLYFLLISSVLNIGLDLLFVAVFDWGVAGAAAATDIAQAASFVAAYIYMAAVRCVSGSKSSCRTDAHSDLRSLRKSTCYIPFPVQ